MQDEVFLPVNQREDLFEVNAFQWRDAIVILGEYRAFGVEDAQSTSSMARRSLPPATPILMACLHRCPLSDEVLQVFRNVIGLVVMAVSVDPLQRSTRRSQSQTDVGVSNAVCMHGEPQHRFTT